MKKIAVLLFIFILFLNGCYKNENEVLDYKIILPQTRSPQNMNQWAVTKFGPLKLRIEPKEDSEIINHLPIGAVIELERKENELKNFENLTNYWYYINYKGEKGWLFGYYIDIFNKEEDAIKRSEELLFHSTTF